MDMDSVLLRSMVFSGSGFLSGIDWVTLVALLAIGLLYFLAPVLGYRPGQRGLLLASLWVLLGKMAMGVLKLCILALEILDRPGKVTSTGQTASSVSKAPETLFILMSVFEAGLFVLGIALFVIGLTTLRREMDLPRPLSRNFPDD
jgi:hypothetical protein